MPNEDINNNNNKPVYTTTTNNNNNIERENIFQKIKNSLSNKPFKKLYRLGLLIFLIIISNNTNSNYVSDLLSNTLKENICKNLTMVQ